MKPQILIFLLCYSSISLCQNISFPPPQKPISDKSLLNFLDQLKLAIHTKDKTKFMSLVADDIEFLFDGENTKSDFEKHWLLNGSENLFWAMMQKLVAFPGDYELTDSKNRTYDKDLFVIPYVTNFDDKGMDNGFNENFIIGENVNIRKDPNVKSNVVTRLSYNLVYTIRDKDDRDITSGYLLSGLPEWHKVETPDKKFSGWVYYKYLHNVFSNRLYITKRDNKWMLTHLTSGD